MFLTLAFVATLASTRWTACGLWNCSCQGFSDTFGTRAWHWGSATTNKAAKMWWLRNRCDTLPTLPPQGTVFSWPNSADRAYSTLVLANGYSRDTLERLTVLLSSLSDSGTREPVFVMTDAVPGGTCHTEVSHLSGMFGASVVLVPMIVGPKDPYGYFTKLNMFRAPVRRLVFLDVDTIVLKNIDGLFETPGVGSRGCCGPRWAAVLDRGDACPSAGTSQRWLRYCRNNLAREFNTGVVVLAPSNTTFQQMMTVVKHHPFVVSDNTDQGFLNSFFQRDVIELPRLYNTIALLEQYEPGFSVDRVCVLHYAGHHKPLLSTSTHPGRNLTTSIYKHYAKKHTGHIRDAVATHASSG